MTSLEFRAGILHAAATLRAESDRLAMVSDGARKLCLLDAAERLEVEARRRDLRPAGAGDVAQPDLLEGGR